MTQPRRFLPGTTYFITRRCSQRQLWLKPTPRTNQIFLYCLAAAAAKTGVRVHAACVMSNHYHVLATDPDTRIAEFYRWLHKYVAKAVNASYGRWENLWSSEKTSVIPLTSARDVLSKIVYILCNPVQAQLVAQGRRWPGVWFFDESFSQLIKMPEVYFRKKGTMPRQLRLDIAVPPQLSHLTAFEYRSLVQNEVLKKEKKIVAKVAARGESFLGIRGIVLQKPSQSPPSREHRRELNPRVAAKSKWQRIEAIHRNKDFLHQYGEALKRWRQGDRESVFPAGTYLLRVQAGVKCAPG